MYSDYMYDGYNPYSGYNYYRNYQQEIKSEELISLNEAITSIKESVGDEREDELFYDRLIREAPDEKSKEVITSIRDDERKHNKILREIYFRLTGQMIPQTTMMESTMPQSGNYEEDLEKALFGELNAVIRYRRIMGAMEDRNMYTLVMSIMTDEIRHASKYNYLLHRVH